MKNKLFLTIAILFFSFTIIAQDDAVDVETSVNQISESEYELVFDFYIDDEWHLYSQYNPENASEPLKILPGDSGAGYTLDGKAKESETHTEYSSTWDTDEIFFIEEATLKQKVTITDKTLESIKILIKGQVCKEFCLPFEKEVDFKLKTNSAEKEAKEEEKKDVSSNAITETPIIKYTEKNPDLIYYLIGFGLIGALIGFLFFKKK